MQNKRGCKTNVGVHQQILVMAHFTPLDGVICVVDLPYLRLGIKRNISTSFHDIPGLVLFQCL